MINAYLGIDIGTSGVRGCCIDENAIELAQASIAISPPALNDGRCEQDPNIWWQATIDVIQSISKSLKDTQIRAMAIDGTSGTVLLTDEKGNPLSAALMYNDQRCLSEAKQISNIAPADSAAHGASSGLAKLLYLFKQNPNAEMLCHQADWVGAKLSGNYGVSDQNNCLKTGYDPVTQCWPAFIQTLGLPEALLPKVVSAGTCIGVVQTDIAKTLGLPLDCKLIAGTTDSIAAFIATGAHEVGTGVTSLGSTLSLKMITSNPVFSGKDGIYSHRLGDAWLVGGASNSGGRVLRQHFTQQQINELTPLLNADKRSGLNYYPLPEKGERFPINNAELEPHITPRPENDLEFFQALLEGITDIEKTGYEKLQTLSDTQLTNIITSGGGSSNTEWTKIRQDMIGTTVTTAEQTEASYGSALLAKQGHRDQQRD